MKTLILFLVIIASFSCHEKKQDLLDNISLEVSDHNYSYNLETGVYKIKEINFCDTVFLSAVQKSKVKKVIFQFHIDTLIGEKIVIPKEPMIMPDNGNTINIKIGNNHSSLYISNQLNRNSQLDKVKNDIYMFDRKIFKILNENAGYKNCMKTLKENYKKLPPTL